MQIKKCLSQLRIGQVQVYLINFLIIVKNDIFNVILLFLPCLDYKISPLLYLNYEIILYIIRKNTYDNIKYFVIL